MKRLKKLLFLPIFGLLFATSLTPVLSTPVSAVPAGQNTSENAENTSETTPDDAEDTPEDFEEVELTDEETEEEEETAAEKDSPSCFDVVGSMGWLICPFTTLVSSAVDSLYALINQFLVIEPITFNDNSPIYVVWEYARTVTNVVFIIFFLIIIISQLTGLGFDNYNIKKTLPRIIIAAVLVNLSFVICSLAVDASNVIGASARGFFGSIIETVKHNNVEVLGGELTWSGVIGQIFGTGAALTATTGVALFAVGLSGGLEHLIWLIIPVVLGALVSLIIGLATIALRQAVVALLVMISPLAFVAYLLPNTEKYFQKWLDILKQMLFFYPLFSALYGASQLAGWALIANGAVAGNAIEAIIGMAVQVFPLILSFKMLKMSDTVLGKINEAMHKASQPALNAARDFSAKRARLAAADYDNRYQMRKAPPYNPGRLRSFIAQKNAELDSNLKRSEENRQKLLDEYVTGREMNKELSFDKDGNRIFTEARKDRINGTMRRAIELKDSDLRLQARALERDQALGQMSSYMKREGLKDSDGTLGQYVSHMAKNYEDLETQTNAKRRNDLADKRYYANAVLEAGKRDEDGNLINPEAYQRLVVEGAGVDAFDDDARVRNNAIGSVVANAYDVTEAERQNEIKHLTSFLDTQPTQRVEDNLDRAIAAGDVNSIIAGVNILDKRGDVDLVAKHVREFMDSGKLKLGTEDANNLALAFLQHKGSPLIRRLGKFINVETLQYTSGNRGDNDTITFKEFITGEGDFEVLNEATGKMETYKPKYDVISTLKGTPLTDVERTAYQSILESMSAYDIVKTENGKERNIMLERIEALDKQLRPQLVTAIPSYNSGSEQIMAAARYLTGQKTDANGNWVTAEVEGPGGHLLEELDSEIFLKRTTEYLSAFTPDDLVKMKSDILGAAQTLFKKHYGSDEAARAAFKDIFMRNGTISTLLAGDKQKVGAMKKGVRDWLELEPSQIAATQAQADARAAEYEAYVKHQAFLKNQQKAA